MIDVRAGDTVFVVYQGRRGDSEEKTSNEKVVRVGRKYAYIKPGPHFELPFCRKTGVSVHDINSNARANGHGFNVYSSEAYYRKRQFDEFEKLRLQNRIVDRNGKLVDLSPEVVEMIHAVLDSKVSREDRDGWAEHVRETGR